VKPPPFDYVRAESVEDAVRALAGAGGDGKIIAGGQSLVPMMALRVARPSVLVDINRIPGLSGISQNGDGGLRVGALARHAALTRQREHPLLAEAASVIGHAAIRSRGTAGGSIAHADPAAELPVVAAALDAVVQVAGPGSPAGSGPSPGPGSVPGPVRDIAAKELFVGALETALAEDEMITSVTFPFPRRWGFAEFSRRRGDFGLVTVVAAEVDDRIRIAIGGAGGVPYRPAGAEAVLAEAPPGGPLSPEVIDQAAASAAAEVPASGDLHGSAEFRRAMTAEFTRRALQRLAGAQVRGAA
jgi:carbon-monoxide dehydrogenase medium subunit